LKKLVIRCRRAPRPGETIRGDDLVTYPGGKGANQAVAAARLGAKVHMIGRVGNDPFGRAMRASLATSGVNLRFVKTTDAHTTGTATILVLEGGENSIIISPGANASVNPADIDVAIDVVRKADFVLLQLEIPLPTVRYAIQLCRRLGVKTMLDPAPAPTKFPRDLYKADLLTPNETEAATILHLPKRPSANTTMTRLLAAGAKQVALKLGSRGSMLGTAKELTSAPGFKVKVIDTTAAGDCFNAALAVSLSEGMSPNDALRFANAAAALACTKPGAQTSLPNHPAVEEFVQQSRRMPIRRLSSVNNKS
jgi:ribokinase